jgi:hypothetical protein
VQRGHPAQLEFQVQQARLDLSDLREQPGPRELQARKGLRDPSD